MNTPPNSSGSLGSASRALTGVRTASSANCYITTSGGPGGIGVWSSQSTFSAPLQLQDSGSGESVELNADLLITLKLLLEEINNIPDTHHLADLKRGLQVRQAMRILGKK